MRILLLDNTDPDTQAFQCLRDNQFEIESLSDEKELLAKASTGQFSAIVVDLAQLSPTRLGLVEELRNQKVFTPVLGFSRNGSPEDLVTALDKGYDDYVGKNSSAPELVARLKALVRRANIEPEPTTLVAGDIALNLLKRQTRRGEKLIDLQPREFAMLEYMIRNQERPLSKLMIMQNVWNYNFDPQTNIVDVLICRLRSKIEAGFSTSVIQTVRGVGYVFTPNKVQA